ncbi:MAG: DUF368 domain-containing protein [Oscillospiraceae bacterium]|nr:DUF368 domain-containing protein [Oscillospiraceae bacterium]
MEKVKRIFFRILCGFFLGFSVFAPGISGGVIAIAMGVYQDLLRIASNPFKRFKHNLLFCLQLGIGAVLSAVLFVVAFKYLFDSYEKAMHFLFVGLIAGNLPIIRRELRQTVFRKRYLIAGILAFAGVLTFALLTAGVEKPAQGGGAASLPLLALSGVLAGVTMVVPGMSVSMVLIVLGVYGELLFAAEALLRLDFGPLIPVGVFGAGMLAGLVLTANGIKALFEKHPGAANSAVLGLVAGSLAGIVFQSLRIEDPGFRWPLAVIMPLAGFGFSMLFVLIGKFTGRAPEATEAS